MDVSEIKGEKTLEAWLNTRPREDAILIAERAASRVFPLWGRHMDSGWARERWLTALPLCRSLLTSRVARKYPTREVRDATAAAATAAYAAARDAAAADARAYATAAADAAAARAYATAARAYAAAPPPPPPPPPPAPFGI